MSIYDSTQTNESQRSSRIYQDLNLDFQINSATKDIQKITDIEAVKRAVRNLINLNHYEKPFHPEIGSNLRAMLFENMTPQMNALISRQIEQLIQNYEPRAKLISVRAQPDLDRNSYEVTVEFYVINTPTELVDLTVMIERLR